MNKKIIGVSIATLFAATGAFAQSTGGSSVELYGILDAAVGNVQDSLSASPLFPATVNPLTATQSVATSGSPAITKPVTGLFNGGISPTRWGIRGSEDLGGGMKAIFNLDSYFNINSGSLSNAAGSLASNVKGSQTSVSAPSSVNGQLFNDQAWVGLSGSDIGTIAFGRQVTVMGDILKDYDAVQDAQLFSPLGFSGQFAGGGATENKRLDNSVKYTNKFNGFNLGLIAKFGGIAGNSSAGSAYGAQFGYEADGLGIQAAYESATDTLHGANSSTAGDVNVTNFNTVAYMLAAKYAFGDAKITGGYETFTLKKPTDTITSLGLTSYYGYAIGNVPAVTATATCAVGNSADYCPADQTTDVLWLGGDYNFTPAFNLAVGFYDINPKASADFTKLSSTGGVNKVDTTPGVGGAKPTGGQSTQASGNIYEYSLLADYHFSKRTDAYAGVMYSQYKGDNYSSLLYNTSNTIFAIGLRTKF